MNANVVQFPQRVRVAAVANGRKDLCDALIATIENAYEAVVQARQSNLPDLAKNELLSRLVTVSREISACAELMVAGLPKCS
jgi:hypothetical protein